MQHSPIDSSVKEVANSLDKSSRSTLSKSPHRRITGPAQQHLTAARPARRASSVRSAPLKPSVAAASDGRSTSSASGAHRSAARRTASRPASSGRGTFARVQSSR